MVPLGRRARVVTTSKNYREEIATVANQERRVMPSDAGLLLNALGYEPPVPVWDLQNTSPVPMNRWGKDHWTTFAYVETCWVDHRGMLNHDKMRCDAKRHPMFHAAKRRGMALGTNVDGGRYPTRLKSETPGPDGQWGMVELSGHDDYDCLDDAIQAGLIEAVMPRLREPHGDVFLDAWDRPVRHAGQGELIDPSFVTGLAEMSLMAAASFGFTNRGRVIAGQYRAYLAATRRSHQFVPDAGQ